LPEPLELNEELLEEPDDESELPEEPDDESELPEELSEEPDDESELSEESDDEPGDESELSEEPGDESELSEELSEESDDESELSEELSEESDDESELSEELPWWQHSPVPYATGNQRHSVSIPSYGITRAWEPLGMYFPSPVSSVNAQLGTVPCKSATVSVIPVSQGIPSSSGISTNAATMSHA
jgi:hypothetical protein